MYSNTTDFFSSAKILDSDKLILKSRLGNKV